MIVCLLYTERYLKLYSLHCFWRRTIWQFHFLNFMFRLWFNRFSSWYYGLLICHTFYMNVTHGLWANIAGCPICFNYYIFTLYRLCISTYESRKCLLMQYVLPVLPAMFVQLFGGDFMSDFKGLNMFSKSWSLCSLVLSNHCDLVFLIIWVFFFNFFYKGNWQCWQI